MLIGGAGNDTLIGGDAVGAGVDTAVFSGAFATYTIGTAIGGITVTGAGAASGVDGAGVDIVNNDVEFLRFSDRIIARADGSTAPLLSLNGGVSALVIGGAAGAAGATGTTSGAVFGNVVDSLPENVAFVTGGTPVANLVVTDPDLTIAGTRTFTLAGADAASFILNPGNTQLMFIGGGAGSQTNYEAKPVYNVTVNVADANGGSSINYTLNITDLNDNRAAITSGATVNVAENTGSNEVIYRIAATDADTVGPGLT